MYRKVFINHVEVAFKTSEVQEHETAQNFTTEAAFLDWMADLQDAKSEAKITIQDFDQKHWNWLIDNFKLIEAAGGVVKNMAGDLLVIDRLGFADLPKGKIEKGESPQVAAVREVEEECSLSNLVIDNELPLTYHTYEYKGLNVLKCTYWYAMTYSGEEKPKPQIEEDITAAYFASKQEVELLVNKTYHSLKPLFNLYLSGNE